MVVQGAVISTAALRGLCARISVQGALLPTLSAVRIVLSKVAAIAAVAAALWGAGVKTYETADSCTAVPVLATAAATTLLGAENHLRSQQRRQAHVQQGVRSPQQYQQHCEALRPKNLRLQQRQQARAQQWVRSPQHYQQQAGR